MNQVKNKVLIGCIFSLILAFANWPIGYYTFLRFLICGASAYLAAITHEEKKEGWKKTFVVLALLFNPVIPLYFGRELWQLIDILVAILFTISIFKLKLKNSVEGKI